MSTPFKMRGFSGFGNSPLKQDKKRVKKFPKFPGQDTDAFKQKKTNIEKPYSVNVATTNLPGGGQKYGIYGNPEDITKSDADRIFRESGGEWDYRGLAKDKKRK